MEDFIVHVLVEKDSTGFQFLCSNKCNKARSVPKLRDRTAVTMAQMIVETVDEMVIVKQCQMDVY